MKKMNNECLIRVANAIFGVNYNYVNYNYADICRNQNFNLILLRNFRNYFLIYLEPKIKTMGEYFKEFCKILGAEIGYIFALVAGTCSVLSFLDRDNIGIISPILLFIATVGLILLFTFFYLSVHFYKETLNKFPKVLKVISHNEKIILLTEYSDLLQMQGLVTVHRLNEGVEEHVGCGEIINIQNDRKIQIQLIKRSQGMNLTKLEDVRKQIRIKPYVTLKSIE